MSVTLIWIPSHAGIIGNEMADSLAYEAASAEGDCAVEDNQIFVPDLCRLIKETFLRKGAKFFEEMAKIKGSRYFNKIKMKPVEIWFHSMTISGNIIKLICRLRTSHTGTNAHLAEKNIIRDASCECGAESQSADHLFFYCSRFDSHSDALILDLHRVELGHVRNIVDIAFSGDLTAYNAIWRFVQNTKIRL